MHKIFKQGLALASLALLSATAAAQISNTPHNLSSTGTGPNKVGTGTAGTEQVCVFCHTPHASNTAMLSAPLWNKGSTSTAYTLYNTGVSSTIDGEVLAPGAGTGSVSAACLSCHDGTQAMDNMVNAPGSGGYNSTGASPAGWTWTGSNKVTGVANLEGDLRNDHPIGIEYCGGGLNATKLANTDCRDKDFKSIATDEIGGSRVFWVNVTGGTASREKGDIILYTRTFTTRGAGPSVECASCHDPHMAKTTNNSDVHFMRVTTSGSTICLACHTK